MPNQAKTIAAAIAPISLLPPELAVSVGCRQSYLCREVTDKGLWAVIPATLASGRLTGVIVEHGVLPIRPGREAEFEAAFATARPLIAAQPGFQGISMSRSIESPNLYLLLVQWDSVEAHTEGFRKSPEFAQWRALLHEFYESPPEIEHFAAIG
ncbi:hypothetical protein MNVM_28950 [Mycobacterium novum]|uniref:ABM domain-containing protein n=1 Tax=Mycobacterium novum TaxID=2492438 RepID=A0A7I7JRB2_9MYCO|nr:hypothetical protein MNVM_28950 [Mycobacterium novum]